MDAVFSAQALAQEVGVEPLLQHHRHRVQLQAGLPLLHDLCAEEARAWRICTCGLQTTQSKSPPQTTQSKSPPPKKEKKSITNADLLPTSQALGPDWGPSPHCSLPAPVCSASCAPSRCRGPAAASAGASKSCELSLGCAKGESPVPTGKISCSLLFVGREVRGGVHPQLSVKNRGGMQQTRVRGNWFGIRANNSETMWQMSGAA